MNVFIQVIELLGRENVKLSAAEVHNVTELLKKEEEIEKSDDNLAAMAAREGFPIESTKIDDVPFSKQKRDNAKDLTEKSAEKSREARRL